MFFLLADSSWEFAGLGTLFPRVICTGDFKDVQFLNKQRQRHEKC